MIEVVAAVIVRDGRLLLTQRAPGKTLAYAWNTPGGKVDWPREQRRDALAREIREEIGADVDAIEPEAICGGMLRLPHGEFYVLHYAVTLAPDSAPKPLEGQGLGWFTPTQFQYLNLSPADDAARLKLTNHIERTSEMEPARG